MRFLVLEAVDPEERKLRLKKLLQFAARQRKAGRTGREHAHALDKETGGLRGDQPADHATHAAYAHWTRGQRARAIVQKHTGRDYHATSLDWTRGGRRARPRPISNRRDAVKVLRRDRYKRVLGLHGTGASQRKISGATNRWLARFKQREGKAVT